MLFVQYEARSAHAAPVRLTMLLIACSSGTATMAGRTAKHLTPRQLRKCSVPKPTLTWFLARERKERFCRNFCRLLKASPPVAGLRSFIGHSFGVLHPPLQTKQGENYPCISSYVVLPTTKYERTARKQPQQGIYCPLLLFSTVQQLCNCHPHLDQALHCLYHTRILWVHVYAGGGEIDGRVTRAEWREHHLHVSALIADDDSFCEHVKRVWGCGNREEEGDSDPSDGKSNISSGDNSLRGNINSSNPRRSSIRGHQERATAFAEINNGNKTTQTGNGCKTISPRPALSAAREAWGPALPPPTANSNVERSPMLRRGNASAKDGTKTSLLDMPPGVLGLLERARGSLAAGGMRAAFQLLKGFREGDRSGKGKVTLSGFKKAVGVSLPGLKEAEMRILFQVICRNTHHTNEVLFESWKESPALDSDKLHQLVFLLQYSHFVFRNIQLVIFGEGCRLCQAQWLLHSVCRSVTSLLGNY